MTRILFRSRRRISGGENFFVGGFLVAKIFWAGSENVFFS